MGMGVKKARGERPAVKTMKANYRQGGQVKKMGKKMPPMDDMDGMGGMKRGGKVKGCK